MSSDSIFIKGSLLTLAVALALLLSGCAALQPADASGPRSNSPAYPLAITGSADRENESLVSWQRMVERFGLPKESQAEFQPITGTLKSIPAEARNKIFLPKVGAEAIQTEDETRESLRRFINEWRKLLGINPEQLSLVERSDQANGDRIASYAQRPFRFPLRGEFGNLYIRFRADRSISEIVSTCLPDAEVLQASLADLNITVTSEEAAERIKTVPIPVSGTQGAATLPPNSSTQVSQLVAYALVPNSSPDKVELHLAWQIDVANGPIKTIYLDAISGQVIATSL